MFRGLACFGVDLLGVVVSVGLRKLAGARHGRQDSLPWPPHRAGGRCCLCSLATSAGPEALAGRGQSGDCGVLSGHRGLGEQQGGKDWEEGCPKPPFGKKDGDCLLSFPCPVGQLSLSSRPPDCTGPSLLGQVADQVMQFEVGRGAGGDPR